MGATQAGDTKCKGLGGHAFQMALRGACVRGEVSERSGPLSVAAPPPFPQGAPAASKNTAPRGKVGQFLE